MTVKELTIKLEREEASSQEKIDKPQADEEH